MHSPLLTSLPHSCRHSAQTPAYHARTQPLGDKGDFMWDVHAAHTVGQRSCCCNGAHPSGRSTAAAAAQPSCCARHGDMNAGQLQSTHAHPHARARAHTHATPTGSGARPAGMRPSLASSQPQQHQCLGVGGCIAVRGLECWHDGAGMMAWAMMRVLVLMLCWCWRWS